MCCMHFNLLVILACLLLVFNNSTGIIFMCYDSTDILTRSRRANDSTLDTLVRILNLEKLFFTPPGIMRVSTPLVLGETSHPFNQFC